MLAKQEVTVPRHLANRGLEFSEAHTESLMDMAPISGLDFFPPTKPAMYYLPRYVVDKDNECFRLFEQDVDLVKQESFTTLTGVVYYTTRHRVKRQMPAYQRGVINPIECSSPDGVTGFGNPGGDCRFCALSAWPTKEERAIALAQGNMAAARPRCEDRWYMAFKDERVATPSFLDLTGGHRIPIEKFETQLGQMGVTWFDVVVKMSVLTRENRPEIQFSIEAAVPSRYDPLFPVITAQRSLAVAVIAQFCSNEGWAERQNAAIVEAPQASGPASLNPGAMDLDDNLEDIPPHIQQEAEEQGLPLTSPFEIQDLPF